MVTIPIITIPVQIVLGTGTLYLRGLQHKSLPHHILRNEEKKSIYGVSILIIFLIVSFLYEAYTKHYYKSVKFQVECDTGKYSHVE